MTARLLAILLASALTACDDPLRGEAAGARLDGLAMERLEGGREDIADFRGRLVVLNVWATWCGPCKREMPGLQALADSLDPERFAVVGLSIDHSPALVREYLRHKNIGFARHIDRGGEVVNAALGLDAVPRTLVIARDGRVLWEATGERDWGDPQVAQWLQGLR